MITVQNRLFSAYVQARCGEGLWQRVHKDRTGAEKAYRGKLSLPSFLLFTTNKLYDKLKLYRPVQIQEFREEKGEEH